MRTDTFLIVVLLYLTLLGGCVSSNQPAQDKAPPPQPTQNNENLAQQYIESGLAYEQEGLLNSALEQYNLALTVLPGHVQAQTLKQKVASRLREKAKFHYHKGLEYDKQGNYELARKEYLIALQNWPDYSDAKARLTTGDSFDETTDHIVHTLKYGESVSKLSLIYYGDVTKHYIIGKFNGLKDGKIVRAGQRLKVPVIDGIPLEELKEKQRIYLGKAHRKPETSGGDEKIEENIQPTEEIKTASNKDIPEDVPSTETSSEYARAIETQNSIPANDTQKEPGQSAQSSNEGDVPTSDAGGQGKVPEDYKPESVTGQGSANSNFAEIYQQGVELFNQKKYDKAIPVFTQALTIAPENEPVRNHLYQSHFQQGLAFYKRNEQLSAIESFEHALEFNPDCEDCKENIQKAELSYKEKHYNLGLHYYGKENLEKAITEWKKVQRIDPNYKKVGPNLKKAELLFNRLESIRKNSSKE